MNCPPDIFSIPQATSCIFEYVAFNPDHMFVNQSFYELAKTHVKIVLKIKCDADALNIKKFKHYKQLFVYICYVPNLSIHEFACDYANVMGLGFYLDKSILGFGTTRPFNNIKELCLEMDGCCKTISYERSFPSLEKISIANVNHMSRIRKHVRLCDNTSFISNNGFQYAKKTMIKDYRAVDCGQSRKVEHLSINAVTVWFLSTCYPSIKHLTLMAMIYNSHEIISFDKLETLTISIDTIPTNLVANNLKKISVVYTHNVYDIMSDDRIIYMLEKLYKNRYFYISASRTHSVDFITTLKPNQIGCDLREFCRTNGINVIHKI